MITLGYILPPILVVLFFALTYLIAEKKKNYGYIDIVWGASFVVNAWSTILISSLVKNAWPSIPAIVITIAVTIWGMRLSSYLFKRNWNRPEDYRYVKMRENLVGRKYPRLLAFLKIFMSQAFLSILVSTVIIVTLNGTIYANDWLVYGFTIAGAVLWIIGFLFESVGDAQLRRFIAKSENRGKIMDQGLWAYTRHPNYFGESLMWFGLSVVGLSVMYGYIGFVSYILITTLLLFISGVPLLEKAFKDRPGFAEYASRVSVFIPWFPKRKNK
ncbi:MAG: DUF1295 domain-containing protein [Erysipelotrichia bacterium]|jgi:steroid 5-alpha reductase family enzyme|nr:DUF1295 domain-containing protein [Bacilli bacterium]NMV82173.1 DUF1295 domain-containing protein [Erysipelotrichia bacterium]